MVVRRTRFNDTPPPQQFQRWSKTCSKRVKLLQVSLSSSFHLILAKTYFVIIGRRSRYLHTGRKFRVIWPSIMIIWGGCNINPPPSGKYVQNCEWDLGRQLDFCRGRVQKVQIDEPQMVHCWGPVTSWKFWHQPDYGLSTLPTCWALQTKRTTLLHVTLWRFHSKFYHVVATEVMYYWLHRSDNWQRQSHPFS